MAIFLIVFVSIIKLFLSLNVLILPDEAYYWDWSRHLEFSYYDQGPGVALYIRAFTSILGDNLISIRIAALFASSISIFFLYKSAIYLGMSRIQQYLIILMSHLTPAFFFGSFLMMHDSCLLLFWSIALYHSLVFIREEKPFDLYMIFLMLGLGTLSKHTMIFFAVSLILWLLFHKNRYSIFKSKHLYISILLSAIVVSPMIYWNIINDWESIEAIQYLRSAGNNLITEKKVSTVLLLSSQFFTLSPTWFMAFLILPLLYKMRKMKDFSKEDIIKKDLLIFLFINSSVLYIYFFYMSFFKMTQPNWLFASYLPMSILLIYFLNKEVQTLRLQKIFNYLIYSGFLISLFFILGGFLIEAITEKFKISKSAYYSPLGKYGGYREAIKNIEAFQKTEYPSSKIIANRYQDAALAGWYLQGNPFIQSINILQKNQYSHWTNMEKGKDYIIFHIEDDPCNTNMNLTEFILSNMFTELKSFPEKLVIKDGRILKKYKYWYGKNYQKTWYDVWFMNFNKQLFSAYTSGFNLSLSEYEKHHNLFTKVLFSMFSNNNATFQEFCGEGK